jgi:ABC-type nickel/cobalt efflux system permease component RcnA
LLSCVLLCCVFCFTVLCLKQRKKDNKTTNTTHKTAKQKTQHTRHKTTKQKTQHNMCCTPLYANKHK